MFLLLLMMVINLPRKLYNCLDKFTNILFSVLCENSLCMVDFIIVGVEIHDHSMDILTNDFMHILLHQNFKQF